MLDWLNWFAAKIIFQASTCLWLSISKMDPGVPCYLSILRAIYSLLSLDSVRNAKKVGIFWWLEKMLLRAIKR